MRLVPCSQILEDLQESWVAPTFWLRFNSWTAATTAYTASKSRAEESCRGRGRGRRWIYYAFTPSRTHTPSKNPKTTNCKRNMSVVSGQWGVNPSLEWQWDYSIRSLERLWSADSVETITLSSLSLRLSERLCPSYSYPQWSWHTLTIPITACLSQWGPENSRRVSLSSYPSCTNNHIVSTTAFCYVHLIKMHDASHQELRESLSFTGVHLCKGTRDEIALMFGEYW